MSSAKTVTLERVLLLSSSSTQLSSRHPYTGIAITVYAFAITGFVAATAANSLTWALVFYVVLLVMLLSELISIAATFAFHMRDPARARAREADKQFAREREAIREISIASAAQLELLRDRVKLELDVIESRLAGAPTILAIGGALGPALAAVMLPNLSQTATSLTGFGAALSFGALLGSWVLNNMRQKWMRAHFVITQAFQQAASYEDANHQAPPRPSRRRNTKKQ